MVEEREAGRDLDPAPPSEIDLRRQARLFALACDLAFS
jgi:hypothetical protein